MPTLEDTFERLELAGASLTLALANRHWDDANSSVHRLREALDDLGDRIDDTTDSAECEVLTGIHTVAVEQHNGALDILNRHRQLEGWRIGDTRPCGCPVEAVAVACEPHESRWGQAQPDCGDCEFGVPGVRHWAYGCEGEK